MQRLYILFTLCLLAALTARPDTATLSWAGNGSANDGSNALQITEVLTNTSGYNGDNNLASTKVAQNVYTAKSSNGLKLGKSGNAGTLTFTINGDLKPTKVIVKAMQYSSDEKSLTITINGVTSSTVSLTSSFSNYEISLDGNTILERIKVSSESKKRAYLKSITIVYAGSSTIETVATPAFTPEGGTYTSAQTVTIASATSGASIYYTTDESTPSSSNGTLYSTPITISGTTTVKAIAVKAGMNDSKVATATYTIDNPSDVGKYVLVTDASTLKAGDKLIIANSITMGYHQAIANIDNKWQRKSTDVNITYQNNGSIVLTPTDETEIYELGGSAGAWTLRATSDNYSGKYLSAYASNDYNDLVYEDGPNGNYSLATIAINNNIATVQFKVTGFPNRIRYVTNSKLFTCYTNNASGTNNIYIYRLEEEQVEPELEVVTGIDGFKGVAVGSTVRLYLPDSYNARVLYVKSNSDGTTDAYVRDDHGGAMLMQGISPNRPMAYNQHIAGYINGTFSTNADGMPLFVPEDGLTNTAFLVIADPVTEAEVHPKAIAAGDIGSNLTDWVKVNDIETSTNTVTLQDAFGTGYTAPYSGAIVDVSAIAAASGKLYPISENDVPMITYVIDSEKSFISPPSNIDNTVVRVKRSLVAEQWTPLTLPFDYSDFDGEVMEFSNLAPGDPVQGPVSNQWFPAGNMYFTSANRIMAGVPYLVRPYEDYTEFVAEGVTLSKSAAASVTFTINGPKTLARVGAINADDEYSYVGVYSPTTLPDDASYKVMTANGNIVWASDLDNRTVSGTTAYFVTPADQGLRVVMGNEGSGGIITGIADITAIGKMQAPTGIYNIMGVKMPDDWQQLPPGFYIVNGVKTIKR